MMDISSLYQVYVEAGQQPCKPDDHRRGEKINKYRIAKQHLFEALKAEYHAGRLRSDRADRLTKIISESSQNPEAFWGSAKTASSNQAIFVHEKNERLFEDLLRCWKAKEGM